jgi:hypothetical protein
MWPHAAGAPRKREDAPSGWVEHAHRGLGWQQHQPVTVRQIVRGFVRPKQVVVGHAVHERRGTLAPFPAVQSSSSAPKVVLAMSD